MTTAGTTPKKGRVADPGFIGVHPGSDVIIGAAFEKKDRAREESNKEKKKLRRGEEETKS